MKVLHVPVTNNPYVLHFIKEQNLIPDLSKNQKLFFQKCFYMFRVYAISSTGVGFRSSYAATGFFHY